MLGVGSHHVHREGENCSGCAGCAKPCADTGGLSSCRPRLQAPRPRRAKGGGGLGLTWDLQGQDPVTQPPPLVWVPPPPCRDADCKDTP